VLILVALDAGLVAAVTVPPAHPAPVAPPARLVLPSPLPHRILTVPILMYHRIASPSASEPPLTQALTVAPATFAAQMRWLRHAGFHAIRQEQLFAALEHGRPLPSRPVMITFDDGYRDVLWNAAPLLARLRMPATAYVVTGRIDDGDPSFLTWPELPRLEARGIEIGSHTVDHLDLTLLTRGRALDELERSRRALERHLGHPVQWFSYPAGRENPRVVRLVRRAGYVLAVTTRPGELQAASRPLTLRRLEVLDTTGVRGLAALLAA
jgi:peptidoglycan/xylan/chitin deacetylase (PgdA/CDA1 family)